MRLAAVSLLSLSLASAVLAQLTPGAIIPAGDPFPIVADFNGDGLDDLVQERNVIISDGSSFRAPQDLGLPEGERVVGALDVNGDRILDLLTESRSGMALPPHLDQNPIGEQPVYRMYIGDAARHYVQAIEISVGPRPYIADVDGDAKDDFMIIADTEATVLRSRGDGTFDRLAPFRIPKDPQIVPDHRILTGDLNHDGFPDLVMRCVNDLVVLRGLGGGKFAVETRYLPFNTKFGVWSTRLGDVNGDSHDDVIIVGKRSIRVLFGNGRGNFPRSATANIAKTHDIVGLPAGLAELLKVDDMNQPRNLAIGHFTRSDRAQIAAGTVEGDLVIFSYEQNALREVARTTTEFWGLDIRTGSFRANAGTGVYVVGALIWGDIYPRPRVFFNGSTPVAVAETPEPSSGRRRAAGKSASDTSLRVQVSGNCINSEAELWSFTRDGVFGVAQQGQTKVEAVFDGAEIYYRLSAPYATQSVQGVLTRADGLYRGTAEVLTSCGWSTMTVTARAD